MNTIPTNHGPMTPTDIVEYLTYCSYKANRPALKPEDLEKYFPNTAAMEERYQRELREAA